MGSAPHLSACNTSSVQEPSVQVCEIAEAPADPAMLTAEERVRWQRLARAEDRDAYLAAHGLARLVAEELAGVSGLVLRQSCPRCGGTDHGRPAIEGHPEIHVSLSHTRGMVAAIAARTPCGIDVEVIGPVPDDVLSAEERSWAGSDAAKRTRLWVRKEAWIKASGAALGRAVDIDALDTSWVTGACATATHAAAWVVR